MEKWHITTATRIPHLVNSKMIEIKEFRIMKEQNIKKRLKAIKAQVQTAEFKTKLLSIVRVKVTARHKVAVGMKWGGSKQVTVQHVTKFAVGICPSKIHNNIRRITMSTGGHMGRQG